MKKILLSFLVFVLAVGIFGWYKKNEILLAVIKYKAHSQYPVAAHREVPWSSGPDQPAIDERRPNIILIVADDLGNNVSLPSAVVLAANMGR